MRVRAVDFVGVAVQDMGKAQAFYRDTLGLTPLSESDGWSEYDAGNVAISLYHDESAAGAGPSRTPALALAVPDIKAAVAELQAKGSKVLQAIEEYRPCFMATVTDPFGNAIMLHQRKDGTAG